jgi:hypothetical protein
MSTGREQVRAADVMASVPDEAPTQQISLAAVGDRCANCGHPLASDQRYCVNCGERRGKPRFTLADPPEQQTEAVKAASPRPPRRPRASAGFTLIAGVATLLLAMGVGVLIGHNGSAGSKVAASGPTVIKLDTTSPTTAAGTPGATTTPASHSGTKSKAGKGAKASAKKTKVVVQKAAAAAKQVVGGSANVAAPTATTGSSCTAGTAGCQNGKLTGNYFGQ